MKRKPAVAGYFYPGREQALRQMVEGFVQRRPERKKAIGVISPHAGFEYSGAVAGAVFSSVLLPEKFVILGPNHRQVSSRFSIMRKGIWETPLGEAVLETLLADLILERCKLVVEDERAHQEEHSLEVQLPFLQFFNEKISIVPVSIAYHASLEDLISLGRAISQAVQDSGEDILVVASTDMSHYVKQEVAREKDFMAIEKILKLDAQGLYETVELENISMCGFKPVVAALVASVGLGAEEATLVKYQTSGDVTGDYREVVGYAGIRIT